MFQISGQKSIEPQFYPILRNSDRKVNTLAVISGPFFRIWENLAASSTKNRGSTNGTTKKKNSAFRALLRASANCRRSSCFCWEAPNGALVWTKCAPNKHVVTHDVEEFKEFVSLKQFFLLSYRTFQQNPKLATKWQAWSKRWFHQGSPGLSCYSLSSHLSTRALHLWPARTRWWWCFYGQNMTK